jgi:hypothetical protein
MDSKLETYWGIKEMVFISFYLTPNSILFWQKFHSLETSLNLKKTKVQKCEIGFKLILNRRERE